MTDPVLDYPSSPTLTTLRELIGETATLRLVAECGGTWIDVPAMPDPKTRLVQLVGEAAAAEVICRYGGRTRLRIPTGRGHAHGRRLDHREILRLSDEGWTVRRLARTFGCTDRQIWNILAKRVPNAGDRPQRELFGQS